MTGLEIPGYTIKRALGRGGMATVYLALQDRFEREVALKVMAPALSADGGFRERFLREAKIVASISHPSIVAVYDVNEANGLYYIAMEYHPGGDLKSRLKTGLSVRDALQVAKDVARALDFAHGKGYLHRDIKPDNILFRTDGSAVLTDFGIAKATEGDANLTQLGTIPGTPKYMSPEQARGQTLDADSDLYSLGVVLFEMLTGRPPYEAADPVALGILHVNAPIPRLEGALGHFQPLLDRLLAKQPAQRPQSGAQLIREIEALARDFDFTSVAGPDHAAPSPPGWAVTPPPASARANDDTCVALQRPALTLAPSPLAALRAWLAKRRGATTALALAVLLAVGGGGGWWRQQGRAQTQAGDVAEMSDKVSAGLLAARHAFSRHALVAPAEDNALAHYQQVLALQPTHPEARAGVEKIAAALQMQASGALALGRLDEAEQLLAQTASLVPDSPVQASLQQALLAARAVPRRQPKARGREAARERLAK